MYDILEYEDVRGRSQISSFTQSLDSKAQTDRAARQLLDKLDYCMSRLAESGTRSGNRFTKHIRDDIWELRVGDQRILFLVWRGGFVLLHQFRKTTPRTPNAEIERAMRERDDWVKRFGP